MNLEQDERLHSLTVWGTVSYVLHLIVALIIDAIQRPAAAGTWQASHFRWRIRTVLIAAALYLVTAPLWLLFMLPGWLAWLCVSVWFLYRIVRGMAAMNQRQPMEFAI